MRGWWGMHCWNGLSEAQQHRLITVGNLEFGYRAEGACQRPAEVEIVTMLDAAPGPRFYCCECGAQYLHQMKETIMLSGDEIYDDEITSGPYCDYCETTGHTYRSCPARDDDDGCPGHPNIESDNPAIYNGPIGGTFYCDGSCQR